MKFFDKSFQSINDDYLKSVRYILRKNIIFGDALTLTFSDKKKNPIIFSEWSFVDSANIKRRDFSFKHLIETRPFEGHNLFSDLGEKAFLPEPIKDWPLTKYYKIYEFKK